MSKTGCGCGAPYKSVVWAMVLTFILGPVGLVYINTIGSIVLVIIMLLGAGFWQAGAPFILGAIWVISFYWAAIGAERYNRRLFAKMTSGCEG